MTRTSLVTMFAAVALIAAACTSASSGSENEIASSTSTVASDPAATSSSSSSSTSTLTSTVAGSSDAALPSGPSALDDTNAAEFPEPLVPVEEIISGGPPPDGIPPIDEPTFLTVPEAQELLESAEAVVALEVNGEARAYPVRAMVWHEIVNDTVGGTPVSVTYCPLCNSAITYIRVVRGVETTFGTSGRLFASALVMYDRATESLWTHFDGRAVVGVLTGEELEAIASPLMAWEDFAAAYPEGSVLDWTSTGFRRDYGSNPYVGYDDPDTDPFLFRGPLDDRARAKQRVAGIAIDDEAVAYSLSVLADGEANATNVTVGGQDLTIFWKMGQASALDSAVIDEGKNVGSVGVFIPEADSQQLTFNSEGTGFVDEETGSEWTITGRAISGPLEGSQLERVEHLDTFWFAWSTYQPGTTLIEN